MGPEWGIQALTDRPNPLLSYRSFREPFSPLTVTFMPSFESRFALMYWRPIETDMVGEN